MTLHNVNYKTNKCIQLYSIVKQNIDTKIRHSGRKKIGHIAFNQLKKRIQKRSTVHLVVYMARNGHKIGCFSLFLHTIGGTLWPCNHE